MTEHDFQCNIVKTLRMRNIFCFAVPNAQNLMGSFRKEKNYKFRQLLFWKSLKKQGYMHGVSDLIIVHKGKVYFVEIKAPVEYKQSEKTGKKIIAKAGGKQSPEQIKFQQEVEKEGLPYILIDSWKKFEEFLSEVKIINGTEN
jgi:penicillin-binding protein-related factor A (putative recombinase)